MRTSPLALLVLCGVLGAQPALHTTTLPGVVAGTFANTSIALPLGRTGGLIQYWFRGDNVPPTPVVTAVGARPARGASIAARTQGIEVTFSNTPVVWATLSSAFAQNFGPAKTIVFTRKNVNLPAIASHLDADAPAVWMASDTAFVLGGSAFVVQIDLGSAAAATTASFTSDSLDLSTTTTRHFASDPGCGGALAASYLGSNFDIKLTGAPPLKPAWFLISGNASTAGGLPLPYKLDALNMPGCVLGVDPVVQILAAADPSGTALVTFPLSLPADSWLVYAQAVHQTAANAFGFATSNVTRSVLGKTGYVNYLYNWNVDGPTAQFGPFTYNASGVLLLKP